MSLSASKEYWGLPQTGTSNLGVLSSRTEEEYQSGCVVPPKIGVSIETALTEAGPVHV